MHIGTHSNFDRMPLEFPNHAVHFLVTPAYSFESKFTHPIRTQFSLELIPDNFEVEHCIAREMLD